MQNRRGLSSVVTTIILILLIIVALGAIWFVINNFIIQGSNKIEFGGLTIDMVIKNATINFGTGIATVQVTRNVGGLGEKIIAIKFIVEDKQTAEVFEKNITNFVELSSRTFKLNLTKSEILNLPEIYKISIAAVYIGGVGNADTIPRTAGISDVALGLGGNKTTSINPPDVITCTIDQDCGTNFWINGTEICNSDNTGINQYKSFFKCTLGFCQSNTVPILKESCAGGTTCFDATCIADIIPCTVASDCGIDQFVGFPICATNPESVIQDYTSYSCIAGSCSSSSTKKLIQTCGTGEVCSNAECFIPLECTLNSDCAIGKICEAGSCIPEGVKIQGTINSAWPAGVGEYFDSANLPLIANEDYSGNYIIFPTSLETRCLKILKFVDAPISTDYYSYIQLNESKTNISSNDEFQIWETMYGCSLI